MNLKEYSVAFNKRDSSLNPFLFLKENQLSKRESKRIQKSHMAGYSSSMFMDLKLTTKMELNPLNETNSPTYRAT